jgi:hypothetical protein
MPQPRLRCLLVLGRRRQRSAQFRFRPPIYQSISTVQPRLPPPCPTHRPSQSCPPSVRIASNPPRHCTLATQIPIGRPHPTASASPTRGFLPRRFSDAGRPMPRHRCQRPASENLHHSRHSLSLCQVSGSDAELKSPRFAERLAAKRSNSVRLLPQLLPAADGCRYATKIYLPKSLK